MPDSSDWRSDTSSRRRFLKMGTVGGAALLAGCSNQNTTPAPEGGGGGGAGTAGNSAGGGGSSGNRFRVFDPLTSGATPTERHFNPWNPSQTGCWHPGAAVFDRLAVYSPTKNEAYPLMAESWEMSDDTTLEVTISDQWTWHNGDQFVAQDWVMQQQIELAIQASGEEESDPLVNSVEAVDDQHIRIKLNDPLSEIFAVQNTIGIYNGNLARGVFTKHDDDQWSEWHDKLMNGSEEEKSTVIEEITTTKYPKITDDPIGHGPFQVSEVGDDVVVMTKYEDHPHSDNINFEEFSLNLFSTNKPTQPYSTGQVDAAHKGFPVKDDVKKQLPEGHKLFREGRSSNKLFAFNCGHGVEGYDTPFESPNVRKAVAHVFDREQVKSLLQGVNRMFEWAPCRVPGKVLRAGEHESTEWVKDFTLYGQNNTERATQLLEQEGYSKENGTWMTPDGEKFTLNIMNGADRPDISVLKRNLTEFGIDVTQEQVDDATFDERRMNGEYDIMPDGSSANGVTALWSLGLVADWVQSITHYKPEREVPMPVGDPEGSSGTKTINVEEHIRKWQQTGDSQYHKELMWWWNQILPEAEMMYQPDAGAYNSTNWKMDVRDGILNGVDDALYIAPKMKDGTLRYVGD
ncbi:ABC transporter substrate-binding protein [Halopelagius longus]|uniref:ABC transporter substrate-binding protein n=1 Tax=Halopelagius longus TaxID=1236180 RepID=A0A1H1G4S0_9EURY|nr:ABC transporter substrate-binding protein [Halopelagius longus]RDI69862.1 ABC transporter substrate-binding protein [Halopelagius longus]SDR07816.1 peptide/nickel transport system substrate-binding protein [Halopelagius longus]